jgi:hypothetical protein
MKLQTTKLLPFATNLVIALMLAGNVLGQTHTMTGNNVVPSGSKITINSGGSLLLPALGTGLLKNTTGTGVLSIAVPADFPTLNQSTTGSAATLTTPRNINGVAFNGSANIVEPAIGATGKIVQTADGVNWTASTMTWPSVVTPYSYDIRSDGTNFVSYPENFFASNSADVTGFAADQYLTGSLITIAAGDWKVGGVYNCWFDLTKTAAGTGTLVITVRMGTLGTTADTTLAQSIGTFGAGTAAVDSGIFDVHVTFRSVGSGTSAVVQVTTNFYHTAASGAGLFSTPAVGTGVMTFLNATSAGFASNTPTKIGISINGGASFAGTVKTVNTKLQQP